MFVNDCTTVCPRSLVPFYIVTNKRIKTSWTYSSSTVKAVKTRFADPVFEKGRIGIRSTQQQQQINVKTQTRIIQKQGQIIYKTSLKRDITM